MHKLQWQNHWIHANPSERGKHRIVEKDGVFVYQRLISGEWRDQPAKPASALLASKGWRL